MIFSPSSGVKILPCTAVELGSINVPNAAAGHQFTDIAVSRVRVLEARGILI